MMKRQLTILFLIMTLMMVTEPAFASLPITSDLSGNNAIEALVGEQLSYDVSFLWFQHLAEGTIRLTRGEQPGTYVAFLEARTRGFAAMVTSHRVEQYQTVMEVGPDGLLRPLVFSSITLRGEGDDQREKVTSYTFDYARQQVRFQKSKDHVIKADESLPLGTDGPVFDILSAFYNLRIGTFGPLDGQQIHLPTFHRKGIEEIVVAPADKSQRNSDFFADENVLCKVLLDPEVFHTNGRDVLVSFNEFNQPQKAVVKNVIGLGDVRGVLRKAVYPVARLD